MGSLINEDELRCRNCGHVGLWLDGDFDVQCPVCGAEFSLDLDEEPEEDDSD